MTPRSLIVLGTRPEAIKLAPLVAALSRRGAPPAVLSTGQHGELMKPVLDYFEIVLERDLGLMKPGQPLSVLLARCLEGLDARIAAAPPDCVVAQGDTTTVLAAALAAFHRGVPFVHVEAGLRTRDVSKPFPEELNRRATTLATALHCAPTEGAAANLLKEGVPRERIHVTGNTVVDALLAAVAREKERGDEWRERFPQLGERPLVLITGHRRENFGEGLKQVCDAIAALARRREDATFIYPAHLNPNVRGPVREALAGLPNVHVIAPSPYPEFVWLMSRATVILTDSGGVQEEAPSLGKPVLVLRDETERPEAVACGSAELVGTSRDAIVKRTLQLLASDGERARFAAVASPFGDGRAAERIADLILARAFSVLSSPR